MQYKKIQREGRTIHRAVCCKCETPLDCGSMAQQYCPDCKKIVDREKSKERMRKFREKNKNCN